MVFCYLSRHKYTPSAVADLSRARKREGVKIHSSDIHWKGSGTHPTNLVPHDRRRSNEVLIRFE